jgi:hypothetical protein
MLLRLAEFLGLLPQGPGVIDRGFLIGMGRQVHLDAGPLQPDPAGDLRPQQVAAGEQTPDEALAHPTQVGRRLGD